MQLNDIDAVVIDLDGTLADTLGDFAAAVNAMLADLRLPTLEISVIEHSIGRGAEHLVRETLKDAGADALRFDEAWPRYLVHYERLNGQHAVLYDGIEEGLRLLSGRGLKLAVLTNKLVGFATHLLRVKHLDGYFDCIHGGDSFERKKPDPMSLLGTCRALGVEPARTLMVGDSIHDAGAARAAGCRLALVSYGYNHGIPVRSVAADLYIDRLDELDALIAR